MDTPTHPAVAVAVDALTHADQDLIPVGVIDRGDTVAVLVDGAAARFTVFVQQHDHRWTVPARTLTGSARRDRTRDPITPERRALRNMSTTYFDPPTATEETGWFAVVGLAAEDAESVTVTSELDEHESPIHQSGLAFAVVRAHRGEHPRITVRTRDGRIAPADLGPGDTRY
ncbi:hypothetical protein [Nocardia terpenica]|uniref:Uncharacterized protein n=1 Tax=Nocardia terpenica TaxID=455432 RepID=A0A291RQW7_9NOCA|nr:hypothetical protein [Nocardia terpenica]ATL69690.1 hypothetical protein CRH09_29505 [Nocardia terpenica]